MLEAGRRALRRLDGRGRQARRARAGPVEAPRRPSPTRSSRAKLAHVFGTRWVSRHQNVDTGAKFLEESIKLDPENEGAFHYLRDAYGRKGGDWDRVLTLAEEAVTHAGENGNATFLLAQAGTIAWRQLGNLIRARTVFERLSQIEPQHPMLLAFEAQIGEQLSNAPPATAASRRSGRSAPTVRRAHADARRRRRTSTTRAARPPSSRVDERASPPLVPPPSRRRAAVGEPRRSRSAVARAAAAPPRAAAPRRRAARRAASDAGRAAAADPGKIAELRALADKQEANKRYNEYVKTLLQLATMVPDAEEKVALYTKAAELYTGKFANQAEAVKAYEAVIAIDPENRGAIDYLRGMYEKRRDWEKLLGLERREAERLYGDERAREVPRDREARHRARQEARGLHRALARGAQQRSGERRSARRARRSLRALEGLRQARRGAREAGRGHLRQRARRSRSSRSSARSTAIV